eukprot:1156280-Pelagomonas_calceolata.AAC.7
MKRARMQARRGNTRRATYGGEQRAITTGGTERRSIDQSRIAQQMTSSAMLSHGHTYEHKWIGLQKEFAAMAIECAC